MKKAAIIEDPANIKSYFKPEKGPLLLVTLSGLIYNIGMTAGPFFEGQLAQTLYDIMQGKKAPSAMVVLVLAYLLTILTVQVMRCVKRFYVRHFANDTGRNMRRMLYNSLIHTDRAVLQHEGVGALMTNAVMDVDACVEGMRKFTTEVFDTGIVLVAYMVMLLVYDWRLALLASLFTPFAYISAEKLKVVVTKCQAAYKKSAARLNETTMDRVENAVTYRVFGAEEEREQNYAARLQEYAKTAVRANVWENAMPPIYNAITMLGAVLILYFGAKNVLGIGWTAWNIAAFTTFLSCFTKMAAKTSKAAKLFNAVQKAQVSWKRIQPLMRPYVADETPERVPDKDVAVSMKNVSVGYAKEKCLFSGCNLQAKQGMIIGVTGPVACGKSALGKALIGEVPYAGSITINGQELAEIPKEKLYNLVSYQGHRPELISASLRENICLGDAVNVAPYLQMTCLTDEVAAMPQQENTFVGNGGVSLSGGQQDRVALARTLCHAGDVLVLDDPLSAVDKTTEKMIMQNLRAFGAQKIIFLISHRLVQFPAMDMVLWLGDGKVTQGTHAELLRRVPGYAQLYEMQTGGDANA